MYVINENNRGGRTLMSVDTYFTKQVANLNACFGNVKHENSAGSTLKQIKLVYEESQELVDAFNMRSRKEILDAIGDYITVFYGVPYVTSNYQTPKIVKPDFISTSCEIDFAFLTHLMKRFEDSVDSLFCVSNFSASDFENEEEVLSMCKVDLDDVHKTFCAVVYEISKLYNIVNVYDIIHESNMSKFAATLEERHESFEKYAELGMADHIVFRDVDVIGGDIGVLVVHSQNCVDVNGKSYPKGKVLKCCNFREPDASELLAAVHPSAEEDYSAYLIGEGYSLGCDMESIEFLK